GAPAAQAGGDAGGVGVAGVPRVLARPAKKALLPRLEERAPVAVVIEGRAVTAATFREGLDLSMCDELPAGRSDYRFGHAEDGGRAVVARLGKLVEAALR